MVHKSSLRWSDKLVALAMMSKSGDQECPVILKMSQFSKEKKNSLTWHSDAFYTHKNGCKMSLHIYANGADDGKDTHLSAFLYLMKGPYDDKLTWPLGEKLQVKLLNQISDNEHHSEIMTFDDDLPENCAVGLKIVTKLKVVVVQLDLF